MLNRLFIIVGVLAILALAAAFVVPSFIPWGDYRERLAGIAGEVLGAPVRIEGDVSFSLLPQPKLQFSGVSAGPPDAPNLRVERVEADFSLIDFLRDRYSVTRLQLDRPTVEIKVGADGSVDTGMALARTIETNISVANATIKDGTVRVSDSRSGDTYIASNVTGDVRLEALRGPFSFQGTTEVGGAPYALRLTTGQLDGDGAAQLSATLRPLGDDYSLTAEGVLTPGLMPAFSGTMTYRQRPPKAVDEGAVDVGQGDLVMTSKIEATPGRVLLSDYVVIPDENRATTRLLGAADVALGTNKSFNAVISGGVLALPPRDATAEQAGQPYELIRLLRELPLPAVPGLPGTIGVDIAELDLRAFALRNVRLDAVAHDGGWTVQRLSGVLPGDSRVTLAGEVSTATGRPEFSGTLSLVTGRLDALSTLWRKPAAGNPLFGVPGRIDARLDLVGETLSVSDGALALGDAKVGFSAQIGLGTTRDIHLAADLGTLDAEHSAALVALLPHVTVDAGFPATFPKGEFEIVADAMTLAGLDGTALAARGSWDGGVLVVDEISAGDLGGASFEAALTAFGSFAKPELSGSASVSVASADAPALRRFHEAIGTSPAVSSFLAASLPAALTLRLDAPSGDGAQSLLVSGTAGTAAVSLDAALEAGFLRALDGKVQVRVDIRSDDADAMAGQLGLGELSPLAPGAPMHLVAVVNGHAASSLETTLLLEGGGDSLGFSGNLVVTDPQAFSGKGTIKATLSDPAVLLARLGAPGLGLPAFAGSATVDFERGGKLRLDDISGTSGGEPFSGRLSLAGGGTAPVVSGEMAVGGLNVSGLVSSLAGPAALLDGGGLWPDGPLATGEVPRGSSGRVKVTSPALALGDRELLDNVSFDFDWDATTTRLRGFSAGLAGGTLELELAVCCAGPLPDKQVSGRIALRGVPIDGIAPPAVADALSGTLDAAARFESTGGSIDGLLAAMTGEGTYSVTGLRIERLDPGAVADVAGLDGILEMQPEQVAALIEDRLDDDAFESPQVSGNFTIARGVLRSPNVPIEGEGGQLLGSTSLRLADLGLTGSYSLSATTVAPAALVTAGSARVSTSLGGTLLAPEREFDVSGLVDAIMVEAYEAEVARLEQLRAEDEARKAAEAAEKARLAAEAEAARKAAEEAAAKRAAEEAAAKRAEEEAAAARQRAIQKALEDLNRPMDIGLGN